jgi:hypothetical protein
MTGKADEYIIYVDGKETWRSKAGGVCQVPQYILLSDEIGNWAGDIAKAKLPDQFLVDVRQGSEIMELLERAARRRRQAEAILDALRLFEKWRRFGRPVLVGAVSFDLAVVPDIDMEVYCPELRIEHGFQVLAECALSHLVVAAQFVNALSTPDKALYWQLRCRTDDGTQWKIDMWSAPDDYRLPRGENLVQPMKDSLTVETRQAILALKEARAEGRLPEVLSIDLYRAVLDDGVRTPDQMQHWLQSNRTGALTDWRPG